jgi:DNA-binding Lrp family transcriptional regulator
MLFDEFLQQYMRNSNIWLTIAHQSIQQLDEQLRNTVLSLGNYLFGQVPTMEAARILADAVFFRDPYRVKYWRPVYGRILPRGADIPEEPEFMPLEEQRELFAQQLRKLPAQQFLLRPAEREGVISTAVYPISIRGVDLDPVTNEYHYPDQKLLDTLFPKLAAKDGIPIQEILREQETRLTQDITQHLPGQTRTEPLPAEEERQIATLPQDGHPTQEKTRTDPSRRTLDEDQRTFLTFLMANPETPVSALPKELRISAAQGTMIRENLKQHGLIEELDVRTGRIGAGRPTKFVIPTLQAFELMGHEPPQGRGGVVHRALQHAVSEGALAKGYNTKVEYRLPTGAIVDVHLEKWQERIAVEIAVLSKPSREIAHIKQSLEAHYDKIYAVFADTHLLERTSEALAGELTDAERAKIQLLPVSKLTSVG